MMRLLQKGHRFITEFVLLLLLPLMANKVMCVKSMNKRLTNIKCWTEKVSFKMFPKDCRVWFSANAVRQRIPIQQYCAILTWHQLRCVIMQLRDVAMQMRWPHILSCVTNHPCAILRLIISNSSIFYLSTQISDARCVGSLNSAHRHSADVGTEW